MPMKTGEKIRFWRQVRGLGQQELGDRIGTDIANVSRLESGVHGLANRTRKKLALALNVPEECLTDNAPDPLIIPLPHGNMLVQEEGVEYIRVGKKV